MSTATIIMVVLICLGCGLALAGLAVMGYRMRKLKKVAGEAGVSSRAQLQEVMGRARRLEPRFRELAVRQKAVAEKLERLSATARKFH
jgi:hypothetical protein